MHVEKPMYPPSYIALYKSGELKHRLNELIGILSNCSLCPRKCGTNRLSGELGYCEAGAHLKIASAFPHFGEEPPLVGKHGSGTIFLSFCNLRCCFCQNYDISHQGVGYEISEDQLANIMMDMK